MRLTEHDRTSIANTKESIDLAPGDHHTTTLLAVKAGIGETKLKFGFKRLFGTTLHRYIHHKRMQLAMDLVVETDKKLYAIAKSCGYRHLSTFISAFKKHHGHTPGFYRRNSAENL